MATTTKRSGQHYHNPSARERLKISRLKLTQLELMGHDVDLTAFKLEMAKLMPLDILEAVTDAHIERTTAGASQLTVDVLDQDRLLLRSGELKKKVDVKIDGLFFRLASVKKQSDMLTLFFEDREIGVLRSYSKPIKASAATSRSQITRAEFILRLLREPYEYKHNPIPYVIPDLHKTEPVGLDQMDQAVDTTAQTNRNFGIAPGASVAVKGVQASPTQIKNINTILSVGASMVLPRPVMVVAIMTAIQESSITNLAMGKPGDYNFLGANPDDNPVGVFQQIPRWWRSKGGATRNVAKDARAFFTSASAAYSRFPNAALWKICLLAQDEPVEESIGKAYARWQREADVIVTAFGIPGGSQADANRVTQTINGTARSGDYEFYRGIPPQQGQNIWQQESSWTCIQRLAQEVNWRAFFVSGTFYYLDDDRLFAAKPRARVTEGKGGVDYIDFDYDERKNTSTITVNCRIGRWSVPPGAVVELYNMGPADGRWLVTDVSRSLFNDAGTVTLQKPQPQLPEPLSNTQGGGPSYRKQRGGTGSAAGGFANPFPGGWIPNRLDMGWDGTFQGSHIVAPFDGQVTFASYIGGASPWGGFIVIKSNNRVLGLPTRSLYFAEGLDAIVPGGAHVKAGQPIARAAKSPYGDPYATHSEGQIEWGVAEDRAVGAYSRPYAQVLGLGTAKAARMVKDFVGWSHQTLGVPGNPTNSSNAGRA